MSLGAKNRISEQETGNNGANCCSTASSELKLYQTFIFSVPILFTFVLLFLFYWFYLRRRRADWSSLRMRTNNSTPIVESSDDLSRCEMGVKKELREMLPIIVYKESFSVNDTQCSVCLGDYEAEDKLQQIPACGHTFHMYCIDQWLTTHTTCPLCRQSLLVSSKVQEPSGTPDSNGEEASHQNEGQSNEEDPQTSQQPPSLVSGDTDERVGDVRYDEVERRLETAK